MTTPDVSLEDLPPAQVEDTDGSDPATLIGDEVEDVIDPETAL
jgi:hypothetical protein